MKEYLQENEMPINQAAKKVLKNPDPSLLYCLQAAQKAIESGELRVPRPALKENLEMLLAQWSPKGAMEFIEGEHDP